MNEVSEAIVAIRQLQAENARLKRQLAKAVEVINRATAKFEDSFCPDEVRLPDCCNEHSPDCEKCWQQALNSIE